MIELFDKEVNAQNESLNAHEKLCDENESCKERNDARVKMVLMEGTTL